MTADMTQRHPAAGPVTDATGARLSPGEAHGVFRAVLDALARPGSVAQLPAGPAGRVPPALLPALALADHGTGVCVVGGDPGWTEVIRAVTNAAPAPLADAELVVVLPGVDPDLGAVRTGSATSPESAALLSLAVADVRGGGAAVRISGPGVVEPHVIAPSGPLHLLERLRAGTRFPAGFDVLLVDPAGRLLGLPRSTAIDPPDTRRDHRAGRPERGMDRWDTPVPAAG